MNSESKYVFEKQIGRSYNINLLVHEKDNVEKKWVAKISKKLAPWANFKDLDERAVLACRLAGIVDVKVPDFVIENISSIDGYDFNSAQDKINDNVFLTKFHPYDLGSYLNKFNLSDLKNFDEIYKSFVFNLWIGSYDKKTEDYLIDDNHEILSTDYQLSGPGFKSDSKLSIGGWVAKYSIEIPSHTGWCIEGAILGQETPIINYIKSKKPQIGAFEEYISKIESVSDSDIEKVMESLVFYGEGEESINSIYKDFLFERRTKVRTAVVEWINAGYPNQIDQKREHEERKLNYYKNLV
jgi:hypothetical protein